MLAIFCLLFNHSKNVCFFSLYACFGEIFNKILIGDEIEFFFENCKEIMSKTDGKFSLVKVTTLKSIEESLLNVVILTSFEAKENL